MTDSRAESVESDSESPEVSDYDWSLSDWRFEVLVGQDLELETETDSDIWILGSL